MASSGSSFRAIAALGSLPPAEQVALRAALHGLPLGFPCTENPPMHRNWIVSRRKPNENGFCDRPECGFVALADRLRQNAARGAKPTPDECAQGLLSQLNARDTSKGGPRVELVGAEGFEPPTKAL